MRTIGAVHVHSDYSHDGHDSLERLRALALARGIGFIGLTDHAEDFSRERFAAYVAECAVHSDARVTLIPGLEFRFKGYTGLHLLAFGLGSWIEPRTPAEFMALARTAARWTMLAHPVLCRYEVPDEVLDGIDAIEVWNASYNTRYLPDPRAIRLMRALRERRPTVVGVAGLDQHDGANDRQTRVSIGASETDALDALRGGRFVNHGRTMTFRADVPWSGMMLAGLTAARAVYDRIERTQERLARARARARKA
jgi:hypothetical protein